MTEKNRCKSCAPGNEAAVFRGQSCIKLLVQKSVGYPKANELAEARFG